MLSKVRPQVSGIAVMRNVTPGHAASTLGTMGLSAAKLPPPPAKGRFQSCTGPVPSMLSSSPNPCRFIKRMRSSVSSVPLVVTENLNGSPSPSCTHSTSGFMTVSNSSIGSPPKKFISGVPARQRGRYQ